ncbi:MAG: CBS domain-containing protein [Pseudomonadota bacterium]
MAPRRIRDLISGRLHLLPGSAKVMAAAELMTEHHIGAVLVMEDGELKGIFTERDALNRVMAAGRDPSTTLLCDVMTKRPTTISPDAMATHAILMMKDAGFRHLPVVEKGPGNAMKVLGIISLRDFLGAELQEADAHIDFLTKIAEG